VGVARIVGQPTPTLRSGRHRWWLVLISSLGSFVYPLGGDAELFSHIGRVFLMLLATSPVANQPWHSPSLATLAGASCFGTLKEQNAKAAKDAQSFSA